MFALCVPIFHLCFMLQEVCCLKSKIRGLEDKTDVSCASVVALLTF